MRYTLKRYNIFFTILFSLIMLAGCSQTDDDDIPTTGFGEYVLELQLQCSDTNTRTGTIEGIEGLHENKISTLDCFFYTNGSDDDAQSIYKATVNNIAREKTATVKINLTEEIINSLLGTDGTKCKIYVIINRPDKVVIGKNKTSVNELKKLSLCNKGFISTEAQSSFVMDGGCTVTYDKNEKLLSGTVDVKRAAVKISLTVTEVKDVEKDGVKWVADRERIIAYMRYGVKNSYLNTDKHPFKASKDDDYFSFPDDKPVKLTKTTDANPVYEQEIPFYSYSNQWKSFKDKEPYILLVVPWKKYKNGEEQPQQFNPCYYQIPVNSRGNDMLRNHYYKINLSVSTLGSFEKEEPLEITPNYIIADWGKQEIVNADLNDFRYLVVSHTYLVLSNENSVSIPYASSHPVKITKIECTRLNMSGNIVTEENVNVEFFELSIDNANSLVKYKKTLINDFTNKNFDFTPYHLTFTVQHEDDSKFNEEITIIQYPTIYAEFERNSDYINSSNYNDNRGYVIINGYTGDTPDNDKQDWFGTANGLSNYGGAIAPNRYIFSISSVYGTNYRIGDPRTKEPSDELKNAKRIYQNSSDQKTAWVQAPCMNEDGTINNTSRGLEYYYPTDASEATRNVIAPRFMIASAYGATNTSHTPTKRLDGIQKRCASYQEDGYPAGRWRLPTQAEFEFIISLVNRNRLPDIFVEGKSYWCAHGVGTVNKDGSVTVENKTSGDGYSTRCVYDLWYWGNKDRLKKEDRNNFVWGDRPRK